MKGIFLLIAHLFFHTIFGQSTHNEINKLSATCKIWGFLKYYHPNVANGECNWDNELFDLLDKIEQAKTEKEFSLIIENWINLLGEIKEVPQIIQSKDIEYFDKNFDLSWIDENKLFSKNLTQKLRFIEKNRFQGNQFYVGLLNAENIFVKNENYQDYKFNNKNSRILAFFAYWNIIEYFFPYKYLMDQNWEITLQEILPFVINAQDDNVFYDVMRKLTVRLNDTHAIFYKYKKKSFFLPIICKIIDEKMIVTEILDNTITETDNIKIGDVITKINDKLIKEIVLENRNIINGSNETAYLYNLIEPVLSGYSDNIKLQFEKKNKYIVKTINWVNYNSNRYQLKSKRKKESFKLLGSNIGYVNMGEIISKNIPEMIENLKQTKAIVFDLRNYPNDTWEEISNFLNPNKKMFAVYTKPDLSYPGKFKWTEGDFCGTENKDNFKGKVIVLLNEESVSQAEWTAMCFQTTGKTTIIGSQTGGADGNVSDVEFIKAFYTRFSGIGVYYPDKRQTQRIGIIPDIEVKPTIKGIQEGRDEVLERAIQFIEIGK